MVLVGVAAWLAVGAYPRVRAEGRLRRAQEVLEQSAERGLSALLKAGCEGMSDRQRRLGRALALDAITRLRGGALLLTTVGTRPFDPSAGTQPYTTAADTMLLAFEVPPSLRALVPDARVGSAGREACQVRFSEDHATGRAEVPLAPGVEVAVDVDFTFTAGDFGTVVLPVARGLVLARKRS
jgi:hypothetical protein